MVGTTESPKIESLVKIWIPLESGCRDESKYVLLNNVAPQFILKTTQIINCRPYFPIFGAARRFVPGNHKPPPTLADTADPREGGTCLRRGRTGQPNSSSRGSEGGWRPGRISVGRPSGH